MKASAQRSERPSAEEKMTEKQECTSVHEDFEVNFDEGSRPRSSCAEVFNEECVLTQASQNGASKLIDA
jgi:hypothetical protein